MKSKRPGRSCRVSGGQNVDDAGNLLVVRTELLLMEKLVFRKAAIVDGIVPVSYTHLTLPTRRTV